MRITILVSVLAALIYGVVPMSAQANDLPEIKTEVRTVAAFKNGLGFVFRSGEGRLKDGWAVMDQLPAATLGSLWIGTTSTAGPVLEVSSFKDRVNRPYDAVNLIELLKANVGQNVTLTIQGGAYGEFQEMDGVVVSVPSRSPDDFRPSPGAVDSRFTAPPPQIIIVKGMDGMLSAIDQSIIRGVRFPSNASLKTSIESDVVRSKVRVGGSPDSAEITMAYLTKGITWSPSYLINIADGEMMDITLEAVLASDTEDLNDVEVSFVVGYPNFIFSDQVSPMALQQTVAAFLEGVMRGRPAERFDALSNVMRQSVAYNYGGYGGVADFRPEDTYSTTQPLSGESNEDLYFYRQSGVTLKKGDRVRYTVFSSKVPYEHIYLWEIPDSMNIDDRGYRQDSGPSTVDIAQVWHALRIENKTEHPWTTAPAFTVNASMPVAQDVLNYTPPGGKNTFRLTIATDVRGDEMQTEVKREAIQIHGRSYDDVTVEGKLTVRNFKQKPVSMNVKKSLMGEVLDAGQSGEVVRVARRLASLNPSSLIEWNFDLKPGEETVLTYTYKALVSR